MVVMAKTPERLIDGRPRQQITAFLVERSMAGVEVVHRCGFMGLRGIQNGLLTFTRVKVPRENILWGLGRGLKLALMTLNSGRLTLPAGCIGASKRCLQIARRWAAERHQWGSPIGRHEAIAEKLAWISSHLFAMEAVTWLTSAWADRGDLDIRIEAAMAKLFSSEVTWRIADHTLQIRGGRGYETAESLKARGEAPIPVERIFRDLRINLIIEGTSEIMRLFIAREAMDPHVSLAFDLILPRRSLRHRMKTAVKAARFYAGWYPRQWLPHIGAGGMEGLPVPLRRHGVYLEATSRRLARVMFHQMVWEQKRLEKRQLILFRLVDVGVDLFAMAASLSRAAWLTKEEGVQNAIPLADLFCGTARRRIEATLAHLTPSEDIRGYRIAQDVLDERYTWLEAGIVGV
jgi:alkylation response protein AidB-like acyl-CoA dehydrogenase